MRFIYDGYKLVENVAPVWDVKEQVKEYIQGQIWDFLNAAADVVVQLSHAITLIGGGLLVIIWAVTGEKKAGRWFGILFIANAAIKMILG